MFGGLQHMRDEEEEQGGGDGIGGAVEDPGQYQAAERTVLPQQDQSMPPRHRCEAARSFAHGQQQHQHRQWQQPPE
jgi:hypothetical protein